MRNLLEVRLLRLATKRLYEEVVAEQRRSATAAALVLVVFLAMSASCLLSSVCGALVPLTLKKLGADPAVASSIFVTTATDMASMGMPLELATILV